MVAVLPILRADAIVSRLLRALSFSVLVMTSCASSANDSIRILTFGDSLTAGYGLREKDSFPAKLQTALRREGFKVDVLNGGVSGDTTTSGRARLEWALIDKPHLVIVELGANDGLRGVDPEVTRANLAAILNTLSTKGISVLLAGMYAPPNLGADYADRFDAIFPQLAQTYSVDLYPFFLEGVATDPNLNLDDGIHPNRAGVSVIVNNILPSITALIEANLTTWSISGTN